MVQSRIDFVVSSHDSGWTSEDGDWLLSDHVSIGGTLVVEELGRVDGREVIKWDKLAILLEDEDEGWYRDPVGATAYNKLLDLRQKHLKKLRVCGRSKCWWSGKIAAQLVVMRNHHKRHCRSADWIRERYRLRSMIQAGKRKCWEDFCTESGEKSLWEVVRWAKDPCRLKESMGRVWGADGEWVESESDRVNGLVAALFGSDATVDAGNPRGPVECPYDGEEVMGWICDALSETKNNSAAGPDGVGYKLTKAV